MVFTRIEHLVTTLATSGATQDFTIGGETETPIAAFITVVGATAADTVATGAKLSYGQVADGVQAVVGMQSEDNVSTTNCDSFFSTSGLILTVGTSGVADSAATFNSFITGGLRVNWAINPPGAWRAHITLVFGDAEVDHRLVTPNAVDEADLDVDIGFEPDLLCTMGNGLDQSLTVQAVTSVQIAHATNDGASGIGEHRFTHWYETNNVGTSDVRLRLENGGANKLVSTQIPAGGTPVAAQHTELVGFHTDGYTVATGGVLESTGVTGPQVAVMAFRFPCNRATILDGETPLSTGTEAYTGAGWRPKAAMGLMSTSRDTSGFWSRDIFGGQAGALGFFGFDGTTEWAASLAVDDNVSTTDTQNFSATQALFIYRDNGSTVEYSADFSSFDSDGYTLDFDDVSTNDRDFYAILLSVDIYKADVTATMAALTSSAAADVRIRADATATMSALLGASTAVTRIRSNTTATMSALTGAVQASTRTNASITATMSALTSVVTAASRTRASITAMMPALTSAAAADVRIRTNVTATMAALTAAAAATAEPQDVVADATATMPALTAAVTAITRVRTNVTATMAALEGAAQATTTIRASVAATIPALTGQVAADVRIRANATATMPALTAALVASAEEGVVANAAATMPALTAAVTAITRIRASAAATIPALVGDAVADNRIRSSITATMPALVGSLATRNQFTANISATMAPLSGAASARTRIRALAAATMPPLSGTTTAINRVRATAAATMAPLSGAAVGFANGTGAACTIRLAASYQTKIALRASYRTKVALSASRSTKIALGASYATIRSLTGSYRSKVALRANNCQ